MFTTTQVGSWPRPPALLRALRDRREGRLDRAAFERIADGEVRRTVELQVEAGLDVVTDGEHRRDGFYSFVTEKLDGTRLHTLEETVAATADEPAFEAMLGSLDVPAAAISNPTCVGRLARREPLAGRELAFVRELTDRPVKVTLPGPYLLARAMWVEAFTREAYADRAAMADDVVRILREELTELAAAGADFVQFDEPVLTEIVLAPEKEGRTFM